MRALVIGADGFAGRWLVKHLHAAGDSVVGLVGSRFRPPLDGVERVEQCDVRDENGISMIVEAARPDAVYYLAGVSNREEREDVSAAVGVSVVGSMNALTACARVEPHPRLLFVSTGYVYRAAPEPLDERSPIEPDTIYAAAKLAAEHALLAIGPAAGVDVVIARPFNHIGPGQSESFLVPTMARQVVSGGGGAAREIRVADPSVVRDFTDVRDVAAAYRLLMERAPAGSVHNVASGVGTSVASLASEIGRVIGARVSVTGPGGPAGHPASTVIGDARALERLGWSRRYDLQATLRDVLEHVKVTVA
jgi:GDP-4-dehydro-6-deoxy-D-mannose reductase